MDTLVIYPGRFHPFHLGHKASYDWLTKQFGDNAVYIASSSVQDAETSPFSFADKVAMMTKLGVPSGHVVNVKNPYQAREIVDRLSDEEKSRTALVFAVSAKDAERFNFAPKKDGSPSYLQPMPKDQKGLKPMSQHGYVAITPTVDFRVQGQDANSASEIRKLYQAGNDNDRVQIITDLYGAPDPELKDIFDQRLGVNQPAEGIIYGQEQVFAGDAPAKVMREDRLRYLRESMALLRQRLDQWRLNQDYIDERRSRKK